VDRKLRFRPTGGNCSPFTNTGILMTSRRLPILLTLAIAFSLPTATIAREYAPRVVSEHNADAYSMKTFAEFHRWRDLKNDAKARAVFEYLTDKQTGLYPMGAGAWEGADSTYDFGLVRDPVKMINVYPIGFCDVFGPVMAGIWEDAGFGPARTVDLPEFSHVTAEVFYADKWHYLDLDLRATFIKADGSLASLAEAQRDDSLWTRKNGPRFFPMDDLARTRETYRKTQPRHRYGVHQSGHTMDFVLRQGETFTRWWKPQAARWHHHASYDKDEFRKKLIARDPLGPKSKHASFTVHTYGNGRFVYVPNLTSTSTDFDDGMEYADNVETEHSGLTLQEKGEGYVVFEIRTPYVIVPSVGKPEKKEDDVDASVIEIDADRATIEISLDNAATWEPQKITKWPARLDLTKRVAGGYGYLLKIILKGEPGKAIIRSLKITTWVQLAPASLPALRQGSNRLRFRSGDHHGLNTQVVEIRPDVTNEIELGKYLVRPAGKYDPKHRSARLQGDFVIRVAAPPGKTISWFSAGGSFQTHQQQAAKNTRNAMAYAVGRPANFRAFYRADIPRDVEHWHYNAQREVRLEKPTETVYLRYTGSPAVNAIRIYAHCLETTPRPETPIQITHTWREAGERKTFSTQLDQQGEYSIEVVGEPQNESIELAVPSGEKRDKERGR
jgi:hypothetical protein